VSASSGGALSDHGAPRETSAAEKGRSARDRSEKATAAPGADASGMGANASTCVKCTIVGFKVPLVSLFRSEHDPDAILVPKSAIPVPVMAVPASPATGLTRYQIMTLDGMRWVAPEQVELAASR
jgi:hypothetical protein